MMLNEESNSLVSDLLWLFLGDVEIYELTDDDDNCEKLLGRYDLDDMVGVQYDQALKEYGDWILSHVYPENNIIKIIVVPPFDYCECEDVESCDCK